MTRDELLDLADDIADLWQNDNRTDAVEALKALTPAQAVIVTAEMIYAESMSPGDMSKLCKRLED